METINTKTLQLFYAGLMVDSAANYEHFGITAQVAEKKQKEQAVAAPRQLAQLGVQTPAEIFLKFASVFGCADWQVTENADGSAAAVTKTCLACGIAKTRGGGKPCQLYCINPFRGLAAALSPSRALDVQETLWEGKECRFLVR